jgi:DNA-binding GntR family transcriptional regulator
MDGANVYERLREHIVSGAYRAGERLPELALCEEFHVSRTPVREALRRLESEGLVEGGGRGVTVTALSVSALGHAFSVRAALEALTAELAAEQQAAGRLAPAALADLRATAERLEKITAAGDLERAADVNRRFHRGVAKLARNPIAVEMLERLWNQIIVSTRESLVPAERPDVVAAEHRQLLHAISQGDQIRAGRIAGDHARATARTLGAASRKEDAGDPATSL